jgi:hypothetical protein
MPDLTDEGIDEIIAIECQGWQLSPLSGDDPGLANRGSSSRRMPEVCWC